jgi:hypothetical protein
MLLRKKSVLGGKIESTVGTAETIAAADCTINAYDLVINPEFEMQERQGQGGFGRLASIPGARRGRATFSVDLAYDGTNVPAWASTYLPACGLVLSTATYKPKTQVPASGSDVKTVTIAGFFDGVRRRIYGAVGNARFILPTGRMGRIEFDFQGVYDDEADAAIPSSINYVNTLPLRVAGGATSWDSYNLCLESATIDLGNVITARECSTSVAGIDNFVITDRNPIITGNPESKLIATQGRYAQLRDSTEATLSFTIDGPSSSTLVFSIPKAQLQSKPMGDRNGIMIDQLEWQANKNVDASDEELSIVFNHAA